MIRGTDGWDYETLADRLVGEVADCPRNKVYDIMMSRGFDKTVSGEWADCWALTDLEALRFALSVVATKQATVDAKTTMFMSREIEKVDRAINQMKRSKDADELHQRQ